LFVEEEEAWSPEVFVATQGPNFKLRNENNLPGPQTRFCEQNTTRSFSLPKAMSPALPSSTTGLAFPQATLYVLCSCVTFFWLGKVNSVVPEPYLDEVFHIRQAQAYWAGKWTTWDPKITTPPGLYLWSYSLARLFRAVSPSFELDAAGLRTTNALVNAAILPAFVRSLLRLNWMQIGLANIGKKSSRLLDNAEWILSHVTLNICLFPPLFFFSGLYYTDLLSALMVLAAYTAHEYIQRQRDIKRGSHSTEFDAASLIASITLWTSGLFSLLFRQTNIFWVSVYLGGMHVIRTAKRCSKECKSSGFSDVISSSWHDGQVYDPPINGAGFEGNPIHPYYCYNKPRLKFGHRLFESWTLRGSGHPHLSFTSCARCSPLPLLPRCLHRVRSVEWQRRAWYCTLMLIP